MRKFIIPFSAANFNGSAKGQGAGIFNANSATEINTHVNWANSLGAGVVNPEVFYTKQLLDTIRYDANEYTYYRYADEMPIQEKADKLVIRRWSPLRAHTVPLVEGVPPETDKGTAKKYEMQADSYGRYMEFSDRVDFTMVDPVIAHYSREYSIVAIETLDLLAQKELLTNSVKRFAGGVTGIDAFNPNDAKPAIEDFRLMGLYLKKHFIKPRSNGRYHAVVSPEFVFDMLDDPYVQSYMTINQSTYGLYDNATLIPMFGFDFYEVQNCPEGVAFYNNSAYNVRVFIDDADALANVITDSSKVASGWTFVAAVAGKTPAYMYKDITISSANASIAGGYDAEDTIGILGSKRAYGEFGGLDKQGNALQLSYVPAHDDYDAGAYVAIAADADCKADSTAKVSTASGETALIKDYYKVMRFQHTIILGKDALVRTGLSGEGQAKMYVKALGSAGVLDPIDQRQSIGFKINSVGFCSTVTPNAVIDYVNIPTQLEQA